MKKIVLIILAIWLCSLCSCCPTKLLTSAQRDSVRVEIVERFVEISDTVEIEIPIEVVKSIVPSDSSSYLVNSLAESEAKVKDGVLFHSLKTLPQTLSKPIVVEGKVRDSIVYREVVKKNFVEVPRELTWRQKFRMRVGEVALGILTFGIIYFLIKLKP